MYGRGRRRGGGTETLTLRAGETSLDGSYQGEEEGTDEGKMKEKREEG